MRKAVIILLALAAIRLLPRALRSEARAAELLALLWQVTLAAVASTSKTVATEARTAVTETRIGHLSGAQTANPAVTGVTVLTSDVLVSAAVSQTSDINGGINGGTSSGGPNAGSGVAAHTHGIGHVHSHGHTHSYGHVHTLPVV